MRILVTGVAGFVGSNLAIRLLEQGNEVIGVDSLADHYSPILKKLNQKDFEAKGGRTHVLDLRTADLDAVVEGVDAVYHAAALPGISDRVPFADYVGNNLLATHRLLQSVSNVPSLKSFVYLSTSSVYGAHATSSEEAPPQPTSYYGVTKLAAEQLVMSYHRERGLPACSMRLFSVYGPRERPEKLYPRLIGAILAGKKFPLFEGSEKHSRSFTFIGDAVDCLAKVKDLREESVGQIFNLGSDTETPVADAILIVEEIMGRKAQIKALPPRVGDQVRTRACIDKAREALGFAPSTTLKAGLRQEIEWFFRHCPDLPQATRSF